MLDFYLVVGLAIAVILAIEIFGQVADRKEKNPNRSTRRQ